MTRTSTTEPLPEETADRSSSLLQSRPFLLLWLVQTLSQTSQNAVNFTLLVLVRVVVDRSTWIPANTAVGLVVLSFSLPAILVSPLSGVLADHYDRRRILIVTNLLRGIAIVGLLFVEARWRAEFALILIYILAFASGTVGQFFGPALWAMLPALAPRQFLVRANALFNLTFTASQLAGFAVVGPILIKLIGIRSVLAITVGLFVMSATLSFALPQAVQRTRGPLSPMRKLVAQIWNEMVEGVRFALGQRLLRKAIVYLAVATATYLVIAALGPGYVMTVLKREQEDIVYLVLPAGLGVVLGTLVVDGVARRLGIERTADTALLVGGFLLVALAEVPDSVGGGQVALVLAIGLATLLGLSDGLVRAPAQAVLQAEAPAQARGRVLAVFFTVSNSVAFLPLFSAGPLADAFGIPFVLLGLGISLTLVGAWQLWSSRTVH